MVNKRAPNAKAQQSHKLVFGKRRLVDAKEVVDAQKPAAVGSRVWTLVSSAKTPFAGCFRKNRSQGEVFKQSPL